MNPTLRTMYQKARDSSVPLDTIERAIKRGTGELEGVTYEQITYEGYGPGGVAVLIEVLTDNRNRTGSDLRNIFTKRGGSMAEPGAVAWQFERKGLIVVPRSVSRGRPDAGRARRRRGGHRRPRARVGSHVRPDRSERRCATALDEAGIPVESADLPMVASTVIDSDDVGVAKRVLQLIDALDDDDDVQAVYANFDVSEEILEAVSILILSCDCGFRRGTDAKE